MEGEEGRREMDMSAVYEFSHSASFPQCPLSPGSVLCTGSTERSDSSVTRCPRLYALGSGTGLSGNSLPTPELALRGGRMNEH